MLSRYSDMPAAGSGELPAEEWNLVMHAELPIIGEQITHSGAPRRSGNETRIPHALGGSACMPWP